VTLGLLEITNMSSFTLTGVEPLLFDNLGEAATLQTVVGRSLNHRIEVPLAIAQGTQLFVDVATPSTLSLLGEIMQGNGDLVKTNGGILELNGLSPSWDGMLTIHEGMVSIRNASNLGTAVGSTLVNASGTLRLMIGETNETFQLDGGRLLGWESFGESPTINNRLELLSSGRLENVNTTGRITLNGLIEGPGDISYGRGRFSVFNENTYEGLTTIKFGRVDISQEKGLGSSLQGTVVNTFGTLVLQQSVPEPITLRGGEILLASEATSAGTITLESGLLRLPRGAVFTSPLVLANTGGNPIVQGDRTTLTGGITGVGDLLVRGTLTVDQQPLAHDGGLDVNGGNSSNTLTLNTANSYTGSTIVSSGRLVVNQVGALGTSDTPVEVLPRGRLVLNVATTRILDIAGALEVDDPSLVFDNTIVLRPNFTASVTGAIFGSGTFNGEIRIAEETFGDPFLRGGTFNGVISGIVRNIRLGGDAPVFLNANNSYQGPTEVSGGEPVEVNSAAALGSTDQGTLVSGGQLDINVIIDEPLVVINRGRVNLNTQQPRLPRLFLTNPSQATGLQTVAINTPSQYDEWVDVVEGQLEINANTTIRGATVRNNGQLRVTGNNTLQLLSEELTLQSGRVEGRISGVQVLRKITANGAEIGDLPDFEGEIVLEKGITSIRSGQALGTDANATRVVGDRNAVLLTLGSMTIGDDIFLDNATGIDNAGGMFIGRLCCSTPTVTLNGRLDLGEKGSIIGSGNSSSTGDTGILNVFGSITGGDLITAGRRLRMGIRNANNTYSGKTDIRSGLIELAGAGRLFSTSEIVLYEGPESFSGTLLLNNSQFSVPDRIGDSIPIKFRGGQLQATGGTNETLGNLYFMEGDSNIDLTASFNNNDSMRQLQVASLQRQVGATVRVDLSDTGQIYVNEPPPAIGGILPWMLVTSSSNRATGFGIVTEQGIVPLTDYETDINQSSAFNNVFVNSNTTMTSDSVINSLSFSDSRSLDLGDNQLVVNSGGILMSRSTITNGRITAGAGGQYELIVYNGRIEANIVDNGSRSVSVTTTGNTTFSGNNTYSGTTYVNENILFLASETALPDNTDLQIIGGEVHIGYNASGPKHLGRVRIAGDGALTQQFSSQGIFSFDEIVLEDGELVPGQLIGSGQIVKETIGNATIQADLRSTFNGNVVINKGRLDVNGLSDANFIVNDGKLVLPVGGNNIVLAGGELEFLLLTGTIEVTAPSRLVVQPRGSARASGFQGTLIGSGDIAFDSNPSFPGSTSLASDMLVLVSQESPDFSGKVDIYTTMVDIRKEQSLGTGEIAIHPGGRLRLAPTQGNFEGAKFDLPNEVSLRGGEIRGSGSVFRPQQLLGDLYVSGNSQISRLNVLGTTYLADGTRLTTYGKSSLQFLGEIKIGGQTELEYGLTRVPAIAANVDAGVVQLRGTISSDSENAVLNLLDRGLDEIVLDSSFYVAAGQTLQLLQDGQPIDLTIDGSNNSITGGGTLLNPVKFEDGATISPGASPGTLFFGNSTTLGGGTVYEWEINDALGVAGQDVGWDLLQVADELVFDATEQNPFILEVIGLDDTGEEGIVENFDSSQNYQWLIASTNSIIGFNPSTIQIDPSSFLSNNPLLTQNRLFLRVDGGNLFLVHQVPEPTSWVLVSLGLAIATARRRRPYHSTARF